MSWHRSEEGYVWRGDPTPVLGSSYPARVSTDDADPEYRPRPVGFTADLGIAKPVTESQPDTEWELVEAHIVDRDRCDECGNTDGFHFRCCSRSHL